MCKLVELDGVPKMKFSEDPGKATYPSKKTVTRIWINDENQANFDLISLEDEEICSPLILYDPENPLKKYEAEFIKK